jgi:hypothetical protein
VLSAYNEVVRNGVLGQFTSSALAEFQDTYEGVERRLPPNRRETPEQQVASTTRYAQHP